ncbi:chemotaxis protein CheW [Trinickia terrae]|uniref:Chemotaxis protein CheW n=1 Tax=Trinickia terrae TaxID=2571161 RepID=A0A4V5PGB8_9BURK|nr:chemotaxis protein CheW [Trinickia terrae]TKC78960.1 chemotaxis protein CheW [Trinickia terrae]
MNQTRQLPNGLHQTPASAQHAAREYLAFVLGAEHYAIDILCVQEIRGYSHVTHIANAPAHIKGILNLRGVIVPILDLRIRFGNASPTYNDQTIVIVLNVLNRVVGVVVDAVSDVVKIAAQDIMPPPQLGTAALTAHIVGVASRDERMLIVLDIQGVLADDDSHRLDLAAMVRES